MYRAYSLDTQYYKRKLERKFYFTEDESKVFLGITKTEFDFIYENYLKQHTWRFRSFDVKEIFACLMLQIRSGQSQNWALRFINKFTDKHMGIQAFSEATRKILFILAGKNEHRPDNPRISKKYPSFYENLEVENIKSAGKFFEDFVNLSPSKYETFRTSGCSTLTKALLMPERELRDLINWAKNGRSSQEIYDRVENVVVKDFHWICDATYDMGYNHTLVLLILVNVHEFLLF